jgi:hypothetical protein
MSQSAKALKIFYVFYKQWFGSGPALVHIDYTALLYPDPDRVAIKFTAMLEYPFSFN